MPAAPYDRDHLASFPEQNPMPVFEVDARGVAVFVNDAAEQAFPGLREQGLEHPDLSDLAAIGTLMLAVDGPESRTIDFSLRESVFQVTVRRCEGGLRFYAADVTPRVRAERLLVENERRFRATFEQAAVGMAHVALDGQWLRVNERFCQFTGYTRDDLAGLTFREMTHPDDLPEDLALIERLRRGEIEGYTIDKRYLRKDGTYVWGELTRSLVYSPSGEPDYFVSVIQDISRRKDAESRAARELEISSQLLEAARALNRQLDLDTLADTLADVCARVTGRGRVVIMLRDRDSGVLTLMGSRGARNATGSRWDASSVASPLGVALRSARTVISDYTTDDVTDADREIAAGLDVVLTLVAPIVDADEVVGLITVDEPGSRRPFSERETLLVEGIAAQASTAIRNARYYEHEHAVAETLQEMLLAVPVDIPGVEFARHYRAANARERVGGDFIDVFRLDDEIVAITLGDVSGKGISAAVITSLVRDTIRAYSVDGIPPAQLLERVNAVVCHFTAPDMFASCFFGNLDVGSGVLHHVNAGHPPALVLDGDGGVTVLESGGPILGALPGVGYEQGCHELRSGQCVLMYTDGVTEARRGHELFGDERLTRVLAGLGNASPREVVDAVMHAVTEFAQGHLSDDIALLAVRRG